MEGITFSQAATWGIAAFAIGGVILRPWGLSEATWAVLGAGALVFLALLPWDDALAAIAKGTDVYLFLTGMMLLAELARREGLFDWLAAHATHVARGSPVRLFSLVYLVGIVVTTFLSNDATAVVLTPAVYAAARIAKAKPMPYLVICAFIANAASFVLPISNPANLVLYGSQMPPLWPWLKQFAVPSLLSIGATYVALRLIYRHDLRGEIADKVVVSELSDGGRYAAYGIGITAIALLTASALDLQLGLPTFLAGAATALFVLFEKRNAPWPLLREVSWGVIPLVAGLFVLVEGLNKTGVVAHLTELLRWACRNRQPQRLGFLELASRWQPT
jgi:arsenical pump membrane protein